jgi:hypothetical protein
MADPALLAIARDDAELKISSPWLMLFIMEVTYYSLMVIGVDAALQQTRVGLELSGAIARHAFTGWRDIIHPPGRINPIFPIIGEVGYNAQVFILSLKRGYLLFQCGNVLA